MSGHVVVWSVAETSEYLRHTCRSGPWCFAMKVPTVPKIDKLAALAPCDGNRYTEITRMHTMRSDYVLFQLNFF